MIRLNLTYDVIDSNFNKIGMVIHILHTKPFSNSLSESEFDSIKK